MAQKDVGNKVPIYKLKETTEVMKYYDEWGENNKYDQDMVDWTEQHNHFTAYHFFQQQLEHNLVIFFSVNVSSFFFFNCRPG